MKNKTNLIKIFNILLATLLCLLLFFTLEFIIFRYENKFAIRHIVIYFGIYIFVLANLIFDYKKIWNFAFKYRYPIGILIFIFAVAIGLNTSSAGMYSKVIQPGSQNILDSPIWGVLRPIRSDEFIAGTPTVLSQSWNNNLENVSPYIMAANNSVLLFPKVQTLNISVLTNPALLGFIFLDTVHGFSFYNLLPYFLCFFGTFEFFLIFTKNDKILAITGTLLLTFSPAMLWWNCHPELAFGFISLCLFDRLIKKDSILKCILISILLGWSTCCFVAILYPAWQVPYAYLYVILAIWIIINNKNQIQIKSFLYLPISLLVIIGIFVPAIIGSLDTIEVMSNTVYPGARNSVGGNHWQSLYTWFHSIMLPISDIGNPCEYSSFISLYPIPLIAGFIYLIISIYKHKIDFTLALLVPLGIILSIWNYIPIGWFAKISLLYMSTPDRSQLVVGAINIIIIIHIMNKYTSNNKSNIFKIGAVIVTAAVMAIVIFAAMTYPNGYFENIIKLIPPTIIGVVLIYLFIRNTKWSKIIFCTITIGLSLFMLIAINPISIGLSAIYDKPISKKINEINKIDNEGIWISAFSSVYEANFALSNGCRVINSTNFYPQMDLWKKIDPEQKYSDIYNRYAHISFEITNDPTWFKLQSTDVFTVFININDLKKLDISYIISPNKSLSDLSNYNTSIKKIYEEDDVCIYATN